jgi:hypothetical protein
MLNNIIRKLKQLLYRAEIKSIATGGVKMPKNRRFENV